MTAVKRPIDLIELYGSTSTYWYDSLIYRLRVSTY